MSCQSNDNLYFDKIFFSPTHRSPPPPLFFMLLLVLFQLKWNKACPHSYPGRTKFRTLRLSPAGCFDGFFFRYVSWALINVHRHYNVAMKKKLLFMYSMAIGHDTQQIHFRMNHFIIFIFIYTHLHKRTIYICVYIMISFLFFTFSEILPSCCPDLFYFIFCIFVHKIRCGFVEMAQSRRREQWKWHFITHFMLYVWIICEIRMCFVSFWNKTRTKIPKYSELGVTGLWLSLLLYTSSKYLIAVTCFG